MSINNDEMGTTGRVGEDEVVSINLQERGGRCSREVQVVYSNIGQSRPIINIIKDYNSQHSHILTESLMMIYI